MKQLFIGWCLMLLALSGQAQQERITNFDVAITVNDDRSISVVETIDVYATGKKIRRGITRNFPAYRTLNDRSLRMDYQIKDIQKDGVTESYFTESTEYGYMVYIGQREVFLKPGSYSYRIEYRVPNQIGLFENFDEIYWNAIGTDVQFPVEKAKCTVTLPDNASIVQQAAYTGFRGKRDQDFIQTSDTGTLTYTVTKALSPGEAFTIAVGFQKGIVDTPGIMERFGTFIIILLGLLMLLPYYFLTWMRYGQDPPTPASYPLFESPDALSPASISYISKEGYQSKSFAASVISLAIKGFLKIEEQTKSGWFSSSKSYDLIKLKNADNTLPQEERRLFNVLLGNRSAVSIDGEYQPLMASAYQSHKGKLRSQYRSFIIEGHNSRFIVAPIIGSILIAAIAFYFFNNNPYAEGINLKALIAFGIITVVGILLYTYLIKKPTVEKLDLKSRIKGFKMYLEMAEKDRIELLNPPDLTPQHFEAMLPFAFALGVEHTWSDKFKTILEKAQYEPDWNNQSDLYYFSHHFGSSFSDNLRGSISKPAESGGGGMGSGGGGFSGGGGGGGGVGGW